VSFEYYEWIYRYWIQLPRSSQISIIYTGWLHFLAQSAGETKLNLRAQLWSQPGVRIKFWLSPWAEQKFVYDSHASNPLQNCWQNIGIYRNILYIAYNLQSPYWIPFHNPGSIQAIKFSQRISKLKHNVRYDVIYQERLGVKIITDPRNGFAPVGTIMSSQGTIPKMGVKTRVRPIAWWSPIPITW